MPYYKFFERDMAAIPAEKIALIDKPSEIPAVTFDEKNLYLAGNDDDYCKVGYGNFDDGTGFVANETYMPNVKGEMLSWWFAWHSVGSDLRYKIWDSEDHYFARANNVEYVCNEKIPVSQKTWGITHYQRRAVKAHCFSRGEFVKNLAAILPEVYAENKNNL